MEKTVITWSVENWITIFLMVLIGSTVIGFGAKLIHKVAPK